jgi:hypothetical protein
MKAAAIPLAAAEKAEEFPRAEAACTSAAIRSAEN